jgi:hypothetical protein
MKLLKITTIYQIFIHLLVLLPSSSSRLYFRFFERSTDNTEKKTEIVQVNSIFYALEYTSLKRKTKKNMTDKKIRSCY